jgi:hypothetical protein
MDSSNKGEADADVSRISTRHLSATERTAGLAFTAAMA